MSRGSHIHFHPKFLVVPPGKHQINKLLLVFQWVWNGNIGHKWVKGFIVNILIVKHFTNDHFTIDDMSLDENNSWSGNCTSTTQLKYGIIGCLFLSWVITGPSFRFILYVNVEISAGRYRKTSSTFPTF